MRQLLVYEKKPLNAALFARASSQVQLSEVRSLKQLAMALEQTRPAIVCLQVELEEFLDVTSLVRQIKLECNAEGFANHHQAAVIAMPGPSLRGYVTPLYEAGVDLIFWSMLDRDRAIRLIRRRVSLKEPVVGQAESLKSQVWSRLPWKRHGTGGGN